jgi:hypothetical protein
MILHKEKIRDCYNSHRRVKMGRKPDYYRQILHFSLHTRNLRELLRGKGYEFRLLDTEKEIRMESATH